MSELGNRIERKAKRIPRLPRKWRVVRNLACTVLLAVVFILPLLDPDPLTAESAYRRECRANLMGEPEILWQNNNGEKAFIVADGGGYYVYGVFHKVGVWWGWRGDVLRWEKEGDITLIPFEIMADSFEDIALQLILLHNVEGARYAEVEIPFDNVAHIGYNGAEASAQYSRTRTVGLAFNRDGVMQNILTPESPYYSDPAENIEGAALRAAEVGAIERLTWGGNEFAITVRLYSTAGELLREETLDYSFPQVW